VENAHQVNGDDLLEVFVGLSHSGRLLPAMPALLTRISTRPVRATTAARCVGGTGLGNVDGHGEGRPPIERATADAPSPFKSATTTVAPARAKRRAMASPYSGCAGDDRRLAGQVQEHCALHLVFANHLNCDLRVHVAMEAHGDGMIAN